MGNNASKRVAVLASAFAGLWLAGELGLEGNAALVGAAVVVFGTARALGVTLYGHA